MRIITVVTLVLTMILVAVDIKENVWLSLYERTFN